MALLMQSAQYEKQSSAFCQYAIFCLNQYFPPHCGRLTGVTWFAPQVKGSTARLASFLAFAFFIFRQEDFRNGARSVTRTLLDRWKTKWQSMFVRRRPNEHILDTSTINFLRWRHLCRRRDCQARQRIAKQNEDRGRSHCLQ